MMIKLRRTFCCDRNFSCKSFLTSRGYFFKRNFYNDKYSRNEVEMMYKSSHELDKYNQINSNDYNFRCILPPPNVTGKLHLGHALTITIQDVLNRFATLQGHNVNDIN